MNSSGGYCSDRTLATNKQIKDSKNAESYENLFLFLYVDAPHKEINTL